MDHSSSKIHGGASESELWGLLHGDMAHRVLLLGFCTLCCPMLSPPWWALLFGVASKRAPRDDLLEVRLLSVQRWDV